MPTPEQFVFPAVLVLGIEHVDPRTDDLVPLDRRDVVAEEVDPVTPDHGDALELTVRFETVRAGRTVHDERDHGDGSDTRARGRRTSGSLTETRDWQYLPERFDGSANRNMNPCSLDGTDPLARTVLAACVEPDGPVDADGDQARVIDDARHPAFLPGGEAARPWDAATGALVRWPRRRRCSWQRLVAHRFHDLDVAWLVNGLAAQSGIEPSGP